MTQRLPKEEIRKAQLAIIRKHVNRLCTSDSDILFGLIEQVLSLPGREVINLSTQLELLDA